MGSLTIRKTADDQRGLEAHFILNTPVDKTRARLTAVAGHVPVCAVSPPLPAFARFGPQQPCKRFHDAMGDCQLFALLVADDFILQLLQRRDLGGRRSGIRELGEGARDGRAAHGAGGEGEESAARCGGYGP